jgi:hypothetical protein
LAVVAMLATSGALPENVNYAVKSSFLLSFLESVPEVSAKLKEPETKERKFEDVVMRPLQRAAFWQLEFLRSWRIESWQKQPAKPQTQNNCGVIGQRVHYD